MRDCAASCQIRNTPPTLFTAHTTHTASAKIPSGIHLHVDTDYSIRHYSDHCQSLLMPRSRHAWDSTSVFVLDVYRNTLAVNQPIVAKEPWAVQEARVGSSTSWNYTVEIVKTGTRAKHSAQVVIVTGKPLSETSDLEDAKSPPKQDEHNLDSQTTSCKHRVVLLLSGKVNVLKLVNPPVASFRHPWCERGIIHYCRISTAGYGSTQLALFWFSIGKSCRMIPGTLFWVPPRSRFS